MKEGVQHATNRKSYVPVPVDVFKAGDPAPCGLYCRSDRAAVHRICKTGDEITANVLKDWHADGLTVLYVDTAEHRLYQQYAENAIEHLSERTDLPARRKAQIYYKTTRELVRDACESSNMDELAGPRRERWVDNMVSMICGDEAAMNGMVMMLSHDYYTYTHMINVSVMATTLAYKLGETEPTRLREIASGGLLHDVGKMRVNPDVLNSPARLTDAEWSELKRHPGLGLEFLHGRSDITPIELLMVHQHHEKLDGSGYPLGILGREISAEAQLTAIVDIYDALTCKRPYRDAMAHEKAMSILYSEATQKINSSMVDVWRETIENARAAGQQ